VGYRGKVTEQARARELRAKSWTLAEIAAELDVAKSSVSLWVRDVPFTPRPRDRAGRRNVVKRPHPAQLAKLAEIEAMNRWGADQIGVLSEREFLVAGAALYLGEGAKTKSRVAMANTDPAIIRLFVAWVRHWFEVDESRWRGNLYLHQGLDLEAATSFWSSVSAIPPEQFNKPYRAMPDAGIRHNKHEHGCFTAVYSSARTQRAVMGLVRALVTARIA